jgi:hypothetical protein
MLKSNAAITLQLGKKMIKGIVDLVKMKLLWHDDTQGATLML